MMTVLDDIVAEKRKYIRSLNTASFSAEGISKWTRVSFKDALMKPGLSVIAEVKKASPSKGTIRADFPYCDIAKSYINHGAAALSVLTDEPFFHGSNLYLTEIKQQVKVPVLRKDFILEPVQIREAAWIGADAILLILGILSTQQAQELLDCAKELGLAALVEVHDPLELEMLSCLKGVDIVGINNRNLHDFSTDVSRSLTMMKDLPIDDKCLIVAESGYKFRSEMQALENANFDAVLIGEGFVTHPELMDFFKR